MKNRRLSDKAREVKKDEDGIICYEDPHPEKRWSEPTYARIAPNSDGTYDLSFSSENPVMVYGEPEVLSHEVEDANFDRLATVGAILKNHDPREIVGKPELVWMGQDRKGRAKVAFGTTAKAKEAKQEVDDGTLRGVSVGFMVRQWMYFSEDGEYKGRSYPAGTWLAAAWEAIEASLTPIPADPSVGVGRSGLDTVPGASQKTEGKEEMKKRKIKLTKDCERGKAGEIITVELPDDKFRVLVEGEDAIGVEHKEEPAAPPTGAVKRAVTEPTEPKKADGVTTDDVQRMIEAERQRAKEINAIGKKFGVDVTELVERGGSVEQAKDLVLGIVEERQKNPPETRTVEVTRDGRVSFRHAAAHALMIRAGTATIPEEIAKAGGEDMAGWSLMRLLEDCMRRANMPIPASKHEMVRMGFEAGGPVSFFGQRVSEEITVTTSDFPFILANVMNKEMLNGAALAEVTYPEWCKIGSTADFKQASRLKLSHSGKLELVREGEGYNMTKFGEQREVFTMLTYGKLFNLSRQAIINDDLDAFTAIPRGMGMVAAILPNDLAVIELIANGNMADGNALFSTAHSNNTDSSGNAFDSVAHARAGIGNMATKMMQQTALQHADVESEQLQLRVRLAIILAPPTGWEYPAAVLGTSSFGSGVEGVNPLKGIAKLVIEPSLEDSNFTNSSTLYYYGFANPNIAPVIEVAFLDGNRTPFMEETVNTGSAPDGRTYKVRMDAVAKSVDWKGGQREQATS